MNLPFKKSSIYDFVEKNFIYLVVGLAVIILFVFINFLIAPTWRQIREVNVLELEQEQQRLLEAQKFLSDLKVMRDKYASVNYYDIQRLETVLPKGLDKEKLALQLENFGTDAGFTVTRISIEERVATTGTTTSRRATPQMTGATTKDVSDINQANINLEISGVDTYTAFKNFLTYLERYAPILRLSSISYPIKSQFSVILTTYYLSES